MNLTRCVRMPSQLFTLALLVAFGSTASATEPVQKAAPTNEKTSEQHGASNTTSKPFVRFDADLNGDGIIDSIQSLETFKRAQENVIYASTVSNLLPESTVDSPKPQPGSENARLAAQKAHPGSENARVSSDNAQVASENANVSSDSPDVASKKAQSRDAPKARVSCLDYKLMSVEEKDAIDQRTQSRKGGVFGPPPCDPYVSDNVEHPFGNEHFGVSVLPTQGLNGVANHSQDAHLIQKKLETEAKQNQKIN